jgi:hypothetical protein
MTQIINLGFFFFLGDPTQGAVVVFFFFFFLEFVKGNFIVLKIFKGILCQKELYYNFLIV